MTPERWWRDPFRVSLGGFALLIAGGFVAMGLAWRLVDRTDLVGAQVPPLVSGGLGGIGLIVLGVGLATVQAGRQRAADERAELDDALEEAIAIADALRAQASGRKGAGHA